MTARCPTPNLIPFSLHSPLSPRPSTSFRRCMSNELIRLCISTQLECICHNCVLFHPPSPPFVLTVLSIYLVTGLSAGAIVTHTTNTHTLNQLESLSLACRSCVCITPIPLLPPLNASSLHAFSSCVSSGFVTFLTCTSILRIRTKSRRHMWPPSCVMCCCMRVRVYVRVYVCVRV